MTAYVASASVEGATTPFLKRHCLLTVPDRQQKKSTMATPTSAFTTAKMHCSAIPAATLPRVCEEGSPVPQATSNSNRTVTAPHTLRLSLWRRTQQPMQRAMRKRSQVARCVRAKKGKSATQKESITGLQLCVCVCGEEGEWTVGMAS